MFIRKFQIKNVYTRKSKFGQEHTYFRTQIIALFRCDNCDGEFQRPIGKIDPKRLSNGFFHVCSNCDTKRFAQRKSAERRTIWDMKTNSDISIVKI